MDTLSRVGPHRWRYRADFVWVEMKAVGGVVSDKQADWHAYLRSIGDTVFVCYGAAAAMEDLTAFAKAKAFGPALTAGG